VEREKHGRTRLLLVSAGIFGLCWFFLGGLDAFRVLPTAQSPFLREELEKLDQLLGGEPVATNAPWYMIAYTRSPTVSIPYNGEAAIEAVLDRYQVRGLVIFGRPPFWVQGESTSVLHSILSGRKTNLGQFQLEAVRVPTAHAVFRVEG
jgi:hypothetical protein